MERRPEGDARRAAPSQREAQTSQWGNPPKSLKSSESFIPTRVPALVSFTSTQHTAVATPSRHNNAYLLCSCVRMVRPLSLSDVIITAASLKPLRFLPGDPARLPYPEAGRANIHPSLWERIARTGQILKTTTARELSWTKFFFSIKVIWLRKRGRTLNFVCSLCSRPWWESGLCVYSRHGVGRKKWIIWLSVIISPL